MSELRVWTTFAAANNLSSTSRYHFADLFVIEWQWAHARSTWKVCSSYQSCFEVVRSRAHPGHEFIAVCMRHFGSEMLLIWTPPAVLEYNCRLPSPALFIKSIQSRNSSWQAFKIAPVLFLIDESPWSSSTSTMLSIPARTVLDDNIMLVPLFPRLWEVRREPVTYASSPVFLQCSM